MDLVEYVFGTGVDDPHEWVSTADLDLGEPGGPDAVALDFDGDGLCDDALWDRDGDGVAEFSVLDAGAESVRFFTDPDGSGTWAVEVDSPTPRGNPVPAESPAAGSPEDTPLDTDGDGTVDAVLATRGSVTELQVDTDADGGMDLLLVDSDGDGLLDVSGAGRPVSETY
ncbi:hypothetical protein [Rhodococcus sp. NPDC003348]